MKFVTAAAIAAVFLVADAMAGGPQRFSASKQRDIAAHAKSEGKRMANSPLQPPARWADLFAPPFSGPPTIMMAITCVDKDHCYVPGGENGAGFDMYTFDGKRGGNFARMNMPSPPAMIMAASLGGHPSGPRGAVGGMGIGNGVQYPVNATTFEASHVPTLMVVTQDIRTTTGGKQVLVIDGATNNAVLTSLNGGASFEEHYITAPMPAPNCTSARYGAIVDQETFFVTLGSWPDNNDSMNKNAPRASSNHYTLSATTQVRRCPKTGKITRHRSMAAPVPTSAPAGPAQCNGYSAAIAKTTDGGKTFRTVFSTATNYYFNSMDCLDAKRCVAVAEGFDDEAGVRVFATDDGETFKQVLFVPSSSKGQYSFMAVRFVSATEAWIGGSRAVSQFQSEGVFFRSIDAGKTWVQFDHGLANIAEITDISFAPDGTGFATAMTVMRDSTILRYGHNGKPIPMFTEKQCPIAGCKELCETLSFPEGSCLKLAGGGSAIAKCDTAKHQLVQKIFNTTACTGASTTNAMPTDKCLKDTQGSYFEVICSQPKGDVAPTKGALSRLF